MSYVNPLAGEAWSPARTDQGVDIIPLQAEPVRAIGSGVVIYSNPNSGWPGGAFMSYRLSDGPLAGQVIYVAEHLSDMLPAGTTVSAGQQIAVMHPGYPWTEWGWANATGDAPVVRYGGLPDGSPTPGGLAFARFLHTLGVTTLQDPGPGPITVGGPSSPPPVGTAPVGAGPSGVDLTGGFGTGLSLWDVLVSPGGLGEAGLRLGETMAGALLMGLGVLLVFAVLVGKAESSIQGAPGLRTARRVTRHTRTRSAPRRPQTTPRSGSGTKPRVSPKPPRSKLSYGPTGRRPRGVPSPYGNAPRSKLTGSERRFAQARGRGREAADIEGPFPSNGNGNGSGAYGRAPRAERP